MLSYWTVAVALTNWCQVRYFLHVKKKKILSALNYIFFDIFFLFPDQFTWKMHFDVPTCQHSPGRTAMILLITVPVFFFHDDPLIVIRRRCVGHACHVNKDIRPHVSVHHWAQWGPVWEYRSLIAFAWWCSRAVPPRCHLCQTPAHVTVNRPRKSP